MSKADIAIVEDEGLVALEIKDALESMGYSVPGVYEDGESLIEALVTERPDLILMDIRIRGDMNGIETARYVRSIFFIPVIFLTAHSDEETIQKAKEAESYGYILKPFEDRALKAAIEIALYKSKQENLLRGSNDWLNIILRCMIEAILVIDLKGCIKYENPQAREILGIEEELTGKRISTVLKLFHPDDGSPVILPLDEPMLNGDFIVNLDYILQVSGQTSVPINMALAPLKNDNGIIIGAICVFRAQKMQSKEEKFVFDEIKKPVKLQKNLLPDNGITHNGVLLRWFFYPSAFGSGDIFNFFKIDDNHSGFYLLDVMGHGFSAAIFSMTLHQLLSPKGEKGSILRTTDRDNSPHPKRRLSDNDPFIVSPKKVLEELNRRFFFEVNSIPFFTIVYGIIDTSTNKATIARAGHLHPLLHPKEDSIISLESEGPAIGIFEKAKISEKQFDFGKGDRLYLFSDGLIESISKFSHDDADRIVKKNLEKSGTKNLLEAVYSLETELNRLKGPNKFDDDIVFMALERE